MLSLKHSGCKNLPGPSFLLFRYCFSRPIIDASKFYNIRVTQRRQLFRCLLAAVAASAIHQD